MRTCARCKTEKPLSAFSPSKSHASGYYPYCKPCRVEWAREWRGKNPAQAREATRKRTALTRAWRERMGLSYGDAHRIKRYGGTVEQVSELLESQNGGCSICGRLPEPGTHLEIDHSHSEPPFIRGLLCGACNRGIGHFLENPLLLRFAADYLERFQAES